MDPLTATLYVGIIFMTGLFGSLFVDMIDRKTL